MDALDNVHEDDGQQQLVPYQPTEEDEAIPQPAEQVEEQQLQLSP